MSKKKRRKWDYDKVKAFVEGSEGNGCKLLSKEYEGGDTLIKILCRCREEYVVKFNKFYHRNKRQCNSCGMKILSDSKKVSYDTVKSFIEVESGSGCKLLSQEYQGARENLLVKCLCGNEFDVSWNRFARKNKYKRQCNVCGYEQLSKSKTLSHTSVLELFKAEGFVLCDRYENAHKRMHVKDINGYSYDVSLNNFKNKVMKKELDGELTNIVHKTNKYSIGNIKKWLIDNEIEYELVSDCYEDNISMLEWICENGHRFRLGWNEILQGRRCSACTLKNNTKHRIKKYSKILSDEVALDNGGYILKSNYNTASCHVLILHEECGSEFLVTPSNFLGGTRCPTCLGKRKRNTGEFKQIVKELSGREYSVLGEYVNSKTHIQMKHNSCGHTWSLVPSSFVAGSRCPKCSRLASKGEIRVQSYIDKLGLEYVSEFVSENCINVNVLPFDIAILNYDAKNPLALIEYDGEQHFEPVDFAGKGEEWALEQHLGVVERDNIKNQYCKDNNIPLLRIPYWDFHNIETILEEFLIEHGVIGLDQQESEQLQLATM